MERLGIILFAVAISVGFYVFALKTIQKESGKRFVTNNHWLCHPNAICYWRAAMALAAMPLYFVCGWEALGILIFTFAAVLDGVDGVVARNCGLVTPWGESLDPLCDKLTYLPPIAAFAQRGQLSMTLVVSLVAIELFGQFLARPLLNLLKTSGAANNFGKIKAMICFGLVIFCALRSENLLLVNVGDEVLIATIVLAAASIVFKFVPNNLYADILSTLNFCCGLISLYYTAQGRLPLAICVIITGQLFDLFDGRMAELHGGTKYGPYLDDIADFISFGIAPAYMVMKVNPTWYGIVFSCILVGSVAYRLYRFVTADKKREDLPEGIFNGLPSPAGALIVLGAALLCQRDILLVFAMASSLLMVSHIRFAHFGRVVMKNIPKPLFFTLSAAIIIIIAFLFKTRSVNMFGLLILGSVGMYMLVGRKFVQKICNGTI